ncbi:unnamed protein product [Trichogramma brassicae]|uniref:Uncharacterized protein n=1 Tax=Trichogramma brassicae TaxID=86971 RepID=A0A6H5IJ90_9HYME|nr:unnamed protein product [Trichogramma brassicae]
MTGATNRARRASTHICATTRERAPSTACTATATAAAATVAAARSRQSAATAAAARWHVIDAATIFAYQLRKNPGGDERERSVRLSFFLDYAQIVYLSSEFGRSLVETNATYIIIIALSQRWEAFSRGRTTINNHRESLFRSHGKLDSKLDSTANTRIKNFGKHGPAGQCGQRVAKDPDYDLQAQENPRFHGLVRGRDLRAVDARGRGHTEENRRSVLRKFETIVLPLHDLGVHGCLHAVLHKPGGGPCAGLPRLEALRHRHELEVLSDLSASELGRDDRCDDQRRHRDPHDGLHDDDLRPVRDDRGALQATARRAERVQSRWRRRGGATAAREAAHRQAGEESFAPLRLIHGELAKMESGAGFVITPCVACMTSAFVRQGVLQRYVTCGTELRSWSSTGSCYWKSRISLEQYTNSHFHENHATLEIIVFNTRNPRILETESMAIESRDEHLQRLHDRHGRYGLRVRRVGDVSHNDHRRPGNPHDGSVHGAVDRERRLQARQHTVAQGRHTEADGSTRARAAGSIERERGCDSTGLRRKSEVSQTVYDTIQFFTNYFFSQIKHALVSAHGSIERDDDDAAVSRRRPAPAQSALPGLASVQLFRLRGRLRADLRAPAAGQLRHGPVARGQRHPHNGPDDTDLLSIRDSQVSPRRDRRHGQRWRLRIIEVRRGSP